MRKISNPTTSLRDEPMRAHLGLLLSLVALNIGLQLVNATLIKFVSRMSVAQLGLIAGVLSVVAVLSFGRFVVWGVMHKYFPVSIAYPATALFFPCLVTIAAAFGEPVSVAQAAGASLVTLGVVLLVLPSRLAQDESLA